MRLHNVCVCVCVFMLTLVWEPKRRVGAEPGAGQQPHGGAGEAAAGAPGGGEGEREAQGEADTPIMDEPGLLVLGTVKPMSSSYKYNAVWHMDRVQNEHLPPANGW